MTGKKRKTGFQEVNPEMEGIFHDMCTPLSVIKGFLDKVPISDEETREFHGIAKKSLQTLLGLVDGLKTPASAISLNYAHHDIAKTVHQAIEGVLPRAWERGIKVKYIGPAQVFGCVDSVQVERVIANLVQNAIEASSIGDEVRVELFTRDGTVCVEIADTGCGIANQHLPKIFERGFTSGKDSGTGTGLNLCKKIVADHGGTIDVFSIKERGSIFTITLPSPQFGQRHEKSIPTKHALKRVSWASQSAFPREDTFD